MKDYSKQNLQGLSFKGQNLSDAVFAGSDIRGADFSDTTLIRADFTKVRTGIKTIYVALVFIAALAVSIFSGYMAMLSGHTVQLMLASNDLLIHAAGLLTIALTIFLIICFYLRGIGTTIKSVILPTCSIALVVGLIGYLTGVGTGMGMVYLGLTIFLVTVMFIVGTISRATAGTLSSTVIFVAVALGGGMFGKSLGGGIGTVIMALSCVQISKRALSGAEGFEPLRKVAYFATRKWGTSFRNADLSHADFSESIIKNADFTGAETFTTNWSNSKSTNCITGLNRFTIKDAITSESPS